jgi:5-formyltetrahydrofolate cyclo-ligase
MAGCWGRHPSLLSRRLFIIMSAKQLKKNIRHRMIQARKRISSSHLAQSSHNICQRLSHAYFFMRAKKIGFYIAMHGEISAAELMRKIQVGKSFYLPALSTTQFHKLNFIQVTHQSKLITNQYGIPEPQANPSKVLAPYLLDIVLCPLVAFDLQGHRLGMGGGYYDRTFNFKQHNKNKPLLVGLAHDFQQCKHVPHTDLDIPLNFIVTPTRIIIPKL